MGYESDFSATVFTSSLLGALSYRVGQDRAGRWLAMEVSGRGGGMFASREAAMRFALAETADRPGSVTLATEPLGFV